MTPVYAIEEKSNEPAHIDFRGRTVHIPRGMTISELLEHYPHEENHEVYAAVMNNRVVSLNAEIHRSGNVIPITYRSQIGARIYRQHLSMMLYEVFYQQHPGCHIRVGQAISEGYFFEVEGVEVDGAFLEQLEKGLQQLAMAREPFIYNRVTVERARRLFYRKGEDFKRQLLNTWQSAYVGIVSIGSFVDFCIGPVAPHTGYFSRCKLLQHQRDFILQFPDPGRRDFTRNDGPQPKLYQTLKESRRWSKLLGISHVGDLNSASIDGQVREVIKVAEGLHEKKIADIATDIVKRTRRIVFVAGPSSAGKTTFTKRLSIQLMVNSLRPMVISLDNYYKNRCDIPKDEYGQYDFEALEAIDVALFNEHLEALLQGRTIQSPTFDFKSGMRTEEQQWRTLSLGEGQVLLVEGIHGLNEAMSAHVPAEDKYRIYINALTPLAIDDHNRVHTSDTRLIRRIVRDRHYRGYSAAHTIEMWPSVRRGERAHIFPFQESADVIFDSSLIYEVPVLKIFAERYLLEVPRTSKTFAEAYRLRKFLSLFVAVLPGDVPQTSLLREFIGGSSFAY